MRLLFVHQAFPSQFCHLAPYFAALPGNEVLAVGEKATMLGMVGASSTEAPALRPAKGVKLLGYDVPTLGAEKLSGPDATLQRAIQRGLAVAAGAKHLRSSGFRPDVIVAHPGWGEAMFLKDVFPDAKILLYCEAYFRSRGADVGFDPEFPVGDEVMLGYRMTNAPWPISLDASDWGIAPTSWQRQLFPKEYASRISVIHDGIDTDAIAPNPRAEFQVPGTQLVLKHGEEVVTYVARSLEPHRGFHMFMRAIPEIQRRRPGARIVIVGGDRTSYSWQLPAGDTYRMRMLRELEGRLDLSRIHFCGWIPHADYISILQISSVHVYLTYPFVLSWSLLDAMAAGCLVIGSDTAPVREVVTDGHNGLLVDFFSPDKIAAQVDDALRRPAAMSAIRDRARRTIIERFDLARICLPAQARLIERLAAGELPTTPSEAS
jgi:glycosyltransferase involved in cell wall biosynthesis